MAGRPGQRAQQHDVEVWSLMAGEWRSAGKS
jgi:hypothetical protein